MDDDVVDDGDAAKQSGGVLGFRLHLLAYVIIGGVLFLIDLFTPQSWWFFWPVFGWGVAVAAHWLYVRCLNISDEWAEQRTDDVRLRAYDLSHMLYIKHWRQARDRRRQAAKKPRQ